MPLVLGTRLGPYEIVAPLGVGGMGEVYCARDTRLDRSVALKVLPAHLTDDPARRARFEREARAASSLNHPHICTIYDVGHDNGTHFLVMELINGGTLAARLADGPLPLDLTLRTGIEIADALDGAHRQGLVHRDLKPSNVMLTRAGAKLIDFGLAKQASPTGLEASTEASTALTGEGKLIGTVEYMAPEQLEGLEADARSDLWALGCVLYEMATGRRAFEGRNPASLIRAILAADPRRLTELQPLAPPALERLVRACLAKDPDRRLQTAHDVMQALAWIAEQTPAAEVDRPPPIALRGPLPRAGRSSGSATAAAPADRRTLLVFLAGMAVVVSLGALAVWGTRPRHDAEPALPAGTPRQVTSDDGSESDPAISPDGSLIAYTASSGGNADLWITDLQGASRLRLTDTPAADRAPAWYPDGSAIAFVSDRGGTNAVWKVPRLGGSAVLVVPQAEDPAISPDGTRIAFARTNPAGLHRIHVAPLYDPSHVRMVTGDGDGQMSHMHPAWSPDGRTLAYADLRNLWLVDPDGRGARPLTRDGEADFAPAFSADGRFVLFSSFREGTLALWRVAVAGGAVERLTVGSGPEGEPSISADGSRVAYSTHIDNYDIVLRDLTDGRTAVVSSVLYEAGPSLAPDASALAFASERRGGRSDLWLQRLSNRMPDGPPSRLTDLPGTLNTPAFSPDGRWIAFKREYLGRREVWVLPSGGGSAERFSDGSGRDVHPAWSPDGARLAFAAERAGGTHIHVAPVASGRRAGPALQLTSGETTDLLPSWSPDGSLIAYRAAGSDDEQVRLIPAAGGPSRIVARGRSFGRLRWDAASGSLWFAESGADAAPRLITASRGRDGFRRTVLPDPLRGAAAPGEFDLSADARLLAFTRREIRGDIWLLERPRARPGSR